MSRFPKYTDETRKGNEAVVKLINYFDSHHWVHRYKAGLDIGVDIEFELVENDEFHGHIIKAQVKGRTNLSYLDDESISFSIERKTVNYGIGTYGAFVIFLVDLSTGKAYYIEIHEYLESHPEIKDKSDRNSVTLYFDREVNGNDDDLCRIARGNYDPMFMPHTYDGDLFIEFISDFESIIRYIIGEDPVIMRPINTDVFLQIEELNDKWSDTSHMFADQRYQGLLDRVLKDLMTYCNLFDDAFFITKANPINPTKVFIQLHLNGAEAQAFLDKKFRPGMDKVRKSIQKEYFELKELYRERLVAQ